jgi:hypothetical protein
VNAADRTWGRVRAPGWVSPLREPQLRVNLFSELHVDALKAWSAPQLRRRRVFAGAALVGGTTYYAGKERQEAAAREADQDARLDELEPQGQPPSAPVAAAPESDALEKVAKLHEKGRAH